MVSSKVYENVTYKQISDMKHAIGFEIGHIRGTKHRRYEPYRNYFDAGDYRPQHLEELVNIGLMSLEQQEVPLFSSKVHNIYHVTDDGKEFLRFVTGVEILSESY